MDKAHQAQLNARGAMQGGLEQITGGLCSAGDVAKLIDDDWKYQKF